MSSGETWRWKALADYNSEVARGIVHTPEYDARMALEQTAFTEEQRRDFLARGGIDHGSY